MGCCSAKSVGLLDKVSVNNQLIEIDVKSVPTLNDKIKDKNVLVRIISVYDGDTFTCIGQIYDDSFTKVNVRFCGIDAPEMKTSVKLSVEEKRQRKFAANKSRNALIRLLSGIDTYDISTEKEEVGCIIIPLDFIKHDKYGRPMASATIGGKNVSDSMIRLGYAFGYDGKKKREFEMKDILKILSK